jgi:hypothetical protein
MARGLQAAVATVLVAALVTLLAGGNGRRGAAAQQGVGQPSLIRKSFLDFLLVLWGLEGFEVTYRGSRPARLSTASQSLNPCLPAAGCCRRRCRRRPPAEPTLLAVSGAITNWAEFAAANNISGWGGDGPEDKGVPACLWTGVTCDADGRLSILCVANRQRLGPASGLIIDLRRPQAAPSATATAGCQAQHGPGLTASSALTLWPPPRPPPPLPRRSLQCAGCRVKAQGRLVPDVAVLETLGTFNLQINEMSGPLPAAWGSPGVLPSLTSIVINNNQFTGGQRGWPAGLCCAVDSGVL